MDSFENIDQIADQITEYIESKHWGDLTLEEIELIKDPIKRNEYRKQWKCCFRHVINPLYSSIIVSNRFKFSNPDNMLTCRNMLKDLMDYYYKKGYSREEIINITSEKDIKKKH